MALTKASEYEVTEFTEQIFSKKLESKITLDYTSTDKYIENQDDYNNNYTQIANKLKFDTIIIDPGHHGGKDPGAIGYRNTKEKDIALSVSKYVGDLITERLPDVKVIYTRVMILSSIYMKEVILQMKMKEIYLFPMQITFVNHLFLVQIFFFRLHRSESSLEIMKKENMIFRDETKKL